jgi:hypothetical protein
MARRKKHDISRSILAVQFRPDCHHTIPGCLQTCCCRAPMAKSAGVHPPSRSRRKPELAPQVSFCLGSIECLYQASCSSIIPCCSSRCFAMLPTKAPCMPEEIPRTVRAPTVHLPSRFAYNPFYLPYSLFFK